MLLLAYINRLVTIILFDNLDNSTQLTHLDLLKISKRIFFTEFSLYII